MHTKTKDTIKEFLPPIFLKYFRSKRLRKYEWFGDYKNWEEARGLSVGYDSGIILEKVRDAAIKVKNGEAICERDSRLLERIEYSYPLLAGLMWIAANEEGRLNIIDFGGSLGSSYFQNRFFLETLKDLNWNIVEQKHFVECGKGYFEDNKLRFYESIEECLKVQAPDAILFSNVIQYIEKPYDLINDVVNKSFKYIIFDKTAFNRTNSDRLVIQKISPDIYDASYPCWFLNIDRFKENFKTKYILINEFIDDGITTNLNDPIFKGFIYKKI